MGVFPRVCVCVCVCVVVVQVRKDIVGKIRTNRTFSRFGISSEAADLIESLLCVRIVS